MIIVFYAYVGMGLWIAYKFVSDPDNSYLPDAHRWLGGLFWIVAWLPLVIWMAPMVWQELKNREEQQRRIEEARRIPRP